MNEKPNYKYENVISNSESNFEYESTSSSKETDSVSISNPDSYLNYIRDNACFENNESSIINSNCENNLLSTGEELLLNSGISKKRAYVTVVVLIAINLLNYIDRFSVTGVLPDLKSYFNLNDQDTGLLQTFFIITYMICSPIFGYIGDRYNRINLIIFGMILWLTATLCSSYVPQNMFWLFVLLRSLIGVGESSFSTVAPAIISDLFTDEWRVKLLSAFSIAIPIGSGCGFILSFALKSWFHQWQAAFRCTPIIGLFCLIFLLSFVKDPQRGFAEGAKHSVPTSWKNDICSLIKNRSFMFISSGFTFISFITGNLVWFLLLYLSYALDANPLSYSKIIYNNITYVFGGIMIISGLLGIIIGIEISRRLQRIFPNADAVVCACGLILAAPCILMCLVLAKYYLYLSIFIISIGQILLSLNWALVINMTMTVTMPFRRSSAVACQMMLGHILGDAISPFLIGKLKEIISNRFNGYLDPFNNNYYSMQYAMLINTFLSVIAGLFFLLASLYIVNDKSKILIEIEKLKQQDEITISSSEDSTGCSKDFN